MELKIKNIKRISNITIGLATVSMIAFVIYGFQTDLFTSQAALTAYLGKFGVMAFMVFIVFQAIQVVFPILPGGIGVLGGVLIFGPWFGFLLNYIGICLGSVAAFLIAKRYGTPLVVSMFSTKLQTKYLKWAENKKFPKWFAIAIFMPVAPDDFLCYLAGTTNMTLKKFVTIILLGKPTAIAAYSFGLNFALQHALMLIS